LILNFFYNIWLLTNNYKLLLILLPEWIVMSGPSSTNLSATLAKSLNYELHEVETKSFPDGEKKIRINEDVQGKNIIFVQSLYPPVDHHVMQFLLTVYKLSQMGSKVYACVPYLAYARQDLEFQRGETASLAVISRLFRSIGVNSLLTVDIHSTHGLGYFSFPTFSVSAIPLLANYVSNNIKLNSPLAVSPDFGGSSRVEAFSKLLNIDYISLKKSRSRTTGEVVMEDSNVEVAGRDIILVDDMISTGTSIVRAANYLHKLNSGKIITLCTHALMVNNASDVIKEAGVETVIATNTIPSDVSKVDVTKIIAEHYKSIQ